MPAPDRLAGAPVRCIPASWRSPCCCWHCRPAVRRSPPRCATNAPPSPAAELWRLLSGHFVHLGWAHCLLNAGGLLALAAILPAPLRSGAAALLLGGAIGIALFAALPDLQRYAGFSGINYGLATLALLPRCRGEAVAVLLLAALVARPPGNGWPTAARRCRVAGRAAGRGPFRRTGRRRRAGAGRTAPARGATLTAPAAPPCPRQTSAPATEPAAWAAGRTRRAYPCRPAAAPSV